jgi:hypothetical protein
MVSTGILRSAALAGLLVSTLALAAFAQKRPPQIPQNTAVAPVPSDPLELVTGPIQVASTPASREAALQLLAHARNSYGLRSASQGYDLKVSFTVNSGGQTEYDGAWEMEDISDPQRGLRWTAKAAAGYTTTRIASNDMFYAEGTASDIPLRLQEARAALFDPMPSWGNVLRSSIRTSTATFNGAQITCILLSASGTAAPNKVAAAASGRRWEETEECIDPQSGLLQVHSQVPGRYYAYEYSSAPELDGYTLPRRVTVTEGGNAVSEITVNSLNPLSGSDPSLFAPTEAMRAKGPAVEMGSAQKLSGFYGRGSIPSGAIAHPVCVFGLVTASGKLVEAHSLQPSDPNSQAAVEAAKRMSFYKPALRGARPEQHFVFITEKFVASK